MLYAYGATVIEIVRRKEFGESDITPARIPWNVKVFFSTVLLPAGSEHLGSHGQVIVRQSCLSVDFAGVTKLKQGKRAEAPSSLSRRSAWPPALRHQGYGRSCP